MEFLRKGDPKDGIYRITPKDAADLLAGMRKQRRLSESQAELIRKDIEGDKWVVNGETLILNGDSTQPSLLDGQHRLRACVLANKPIDSYVVWGLSSSASEFDSIDQGRTRTGSDRLKIENIKDPTMQAAVTRISVRYEHMIQRDSSILTSLKVRPREIRTHRARIVPQIDTSVDFVRSVHKALRGLIPLGVVAFVHMKASAIDPKKADSFVKSLATGEGLSARNPVLGLRNNLISRAKSQDINSADVLLALAIKTWNAYYEGREMTLISWKGHEAFPRFN